MFVPANPGAAPYTLEEFLPGEEDQTLATGPTGTDLESFGATLTFTWSLPRFEFKSITSYRDTEGEFYRDPERGAINHHIIELIALSMGSMSSLRELDGQSIARTAMLERIKQYIEINIRHPQLTPAQVAGHHHISERYDVSPKQYRHRFISSAP